MTTPSGTITLNDVNQEIGNSGTATIALNDTNVRWLADTVSGTISMNDLRNKTSIKVVDYISTSANSTTTRTFTGVNFGTNVTGRLLVACYFLYASGNVNMQATGATIGSDSTTSGRTAYENRSGGSVSCGVISATGESGTSGTVTISHNGTSEAGALLMLSIISSPTQSPHDDDFKQGGGSGGTATGNLTFDLLSNGFMIFAIGHANTNSHSMGGVTKIADNTVDGGKFAVGFDNRKGSQIGDTVSASWSGTAAYAGAVASWQQ